MADGWLSARAKSIAQFGADGLPLLHLSFKRPSPGRGTVHAEWVGTERGRDLPARTDTRALFKAALAEHLGVSNGTLDAKIFPESSATPALKQLFRA
jgi:hypothetical protein